MPSKTRYTITPAATGVPAIAVLADGPETAYALAVAHLTNHRLLSRGVSVVKTFNPSTSTYAIAQPRLTRPVYVTITEESS